MAKRLDRQPTLPVRLSLAAREASLTHKDSCDSKTSSFHSVSSQAHPMDDLSISPCERKSTDTIYKTLELASKLAKSHSRRIPTVIPTSRIIWLLYCQSYRYNVSFINSWDSISCW